MIEAKGPGFAKMLGGKFMAKRLKKRWLGQAERQMGAAGSRDVEWDFAEAKAAKTARRWFARKYRKIKVKVVPGELWS
ncbi:hypothetical protein [Methylocystis heyeri]|uniref:hypothetical protein n=1 Tax=Methylocystis heyeri TaxID=391905 RepID=UPI00138A1BF4|nr:hypothetical protein [Methylocystis heyeri]